MNTAIESGLSFVLNGLWRASWQASLLALVVLVAQRLLGARLGGRGRFALWAVVVVRLLLPVLPESRFSVFNLAKSRSTPGAVAIKSDSAPAVAPTEQSEIPVIVIGPNRSAKPQAAEVDRAISGKSSVAPIKSARDPLERMDICGVACRCRHVELAGRAGLLGIVTNDSKPHRRHGFRADARRQCLRHDIAPAAHASCSCWRGCSDTCGGRIIPAEVALAVTRADRLRRSGNPLDPAA